MTIRFNAHMDSNWTDWSEWTSETDVDGDLNWSAGAGLAFSAGGASALINDTTSKYLTKTGLTAIPNECSYRVYIHPNNVSIPSGIQFGFASIFNASTVSFLALYNNGGTSQLRAVTYRDGGVPLALYNNISLTAQHYIDVRIVRATTDVSIDGYMELWIDGVKKTSYTAIDNYDTFGTGITGARLGIGVGIAIGSGVSGTIYLDEMAVAEGEYIGALALNENATLAKLAGISIFEESSSDTEEEVSLSRTLGILSEGIPATVEIITLGKIIRIGRRRSLNINENVVLSTLHGLSASSQSNENDSITLADFINITAVEELPSFINETVILARSATIEALQEGISHVNENVGINRLAGISGTEQPLTINAAVVLNRLSGIDEVTQCLVNDNSVLNRLSGINETEQCRVNDSLTLAKIIQITVLEEPRGIANETVILARFATIEALQEGISHVTENISVSRLNGISEAEQCQVNDIAILNRLNGISETLERFVNDSVTLSRLLGISEATQCIVNDITSLNRLNGISEVLDRFVYDGMTLTRSAGISEISQCQVNDITVLNRLSTISEATQCSLNNIINLNRLAGISELTQCQVYDYSSLAKFIRIVIVDETIGQYSEILTLDRFSGLSVFQEGISHVSESVGFSRLNIITIGEQPKYYNSLVFSRINILTLESQYRIYNNLILSKSNGLNIITQKLINENITANKSNGLNINSGLVAQELIDFPRLNSLVVLDSRYLLENINLQYSNGLSLLDAPTIFERINLGRINILTIITMLYGFNSITFSQIKSIIAEPPSLYVYNDGDHSIGVLFRDKRLEVAFRDKRATTYWRDKREK